MTKMTWKAFTKKLFDPELTDSDPGYLLLAGADIPTSQKMRFMTAWVTFYNIGLAARASELKGKKFWGYLYEQYPTAKRSSERRHFRGAAGLKAIRAWERMFPTPENLVVHMRGSDYFEVRQKAKSVPLVGDYFIFKFADVQERVFKEPCIFPDEAAKFSPKVPQQGAKMIAPDNTVLETYNMIANYMGEVGIRAPPGWDRPANMQEGETVSCVYKQYMHGKWAPGTRTAKAINSLLATPGNTSSVMLNVIHGNTGIKVEEMQTWAAERLLHLHR